PAGALPTPLPPRPRQRYPAAEPVAASVAGRLQSAPPQPWRLHARQNPTASEEGTTSPLPEDCSLTTKMASPETPNRHPDPCAGRLQPCALVVHSAWLVVGGTRRSGPRRQQGAGRAANGPARRSSPAHLLVVDQVIAPEIFNSMSRCSSIP